MQYNTPTEYYYYALEIVVDIINYVGKTAIAIKNSFAPNISKFRF